MSDKTTEFYMAEIHRLTLLTRRLESEVRVLRYNHVDYNRILKEYKDLWEQMEELESTSTVKRIEELELENEDLRNVIQEQQFYVAQRKACSSCEEHIDYSPNLQDSAKYFANLLNYEEQ